MHRRFRITIPLAALLLSTAAHGASPTYGRIATIQIPGHPITEFDISTVDPSTETYFFADRSNAGVDIFDATNNAFLTRIGGFTGYDASVGTSTAGPNGLVPVGNNELWAGNGDSTVKVIDLNTLKIVDSISTGGKLRVDEMAYDAPDHVVVMSNNDDTPPFLTFVSTTSHKVLGKIVFTDATNGLEASVYNPTNRLFYTSVPQVGPNEASSAVAVVDPRAYKIVRMFPISQCQPSGIALGPNQDLLLGCDIVPSMGSPTKTEIIDAINGSVRSIVREIGGSDEVAYDKGDDDFYLAELDNDAGPVLGVISARTNRYVASVPTTADSHSVAVDPRNNHVFVPLTPVATDAACPKGCIGVYAKTGG
jgi:hypothetical protein